MILLSGCVSPQISVNVTPEINITVPEQLNITRPLNASQPINWTGFKLTGVDWKSKNCRLMADICEFTNAEFESACARLFYAANETYLCHMYVDTRLIRDLNYEFYPDIPRVYNFSPNLKTPEQYRYMELRNQTFHFARKNEIKICCVKDDKNATKKFEFRNYDLCQTIILKPYCDD